MPKSLFVEQVGQDELIDGFVLAVTKKLGPVIERASAPPAQTATIPEMCEILRCSPSWLANSGLPSVMRHGKRHFIISDVLEALRKDTPEHEAKAKARQAAKQAAKNKGGISS